MQKHDLENKEYSRERENNHGGISYSCSLVSGQEKGFIGYSSDHSENPMIFSVWLDKKEYRIRTDMLTLLLLMGKGWHMLRHHWMYSDCKILGSGTILVFFTFTASYTMGCWSLSMASRSSSKTKKLIIIMSDQLKSVLKPFKLEYASYL